MLQKLRSIFLVLTGVALLLGFIELLARFYIAHGGSPDLEAYSSLKQNQPRYIAEPFLNYTNNPAFIGAQGRHEFNRLGLKNDYEVTLDKHPATYRILFLGGSTTFSMVKDMRHSFVYRLQQMLNDTLSASVKEYRDVECLNGGLCGGTSAEILNHYLLKLNYLQPDLVVIHAGVNDAVTYMPLAGSQYQPDYHNRRRIFPEIEPLGNHWRWLMKSEAVGLLIYYLKYSRYVEGSTLEKNLYFEFDNKNEWLPDGNRLMFTPRFNAFYNNITNLITVAKSRGQKVLLVTEVVDEAQILAMKNFPPAAMKAMQQGFYRNNELLQQIASEQQVPVCVLPPKEFPPALFPDDDGIHVNEKGEQRKADFIEKYIWEILNQ